jgi:hypothetical protein
MSRLADFATTDRQREIVELSERMSLRQTAKELGISISSVRRHYHAVKGRAAKHGWSPEHGMTQTCPDTHYVKGVSTLYNESGEQVMQWVKTTADQDRLEMLAREIVESLVTSVKPEKPKPVPKSLDSSALAVYPIGDAHVGLYCWNEDAGDDYDLTIARDIMERGFNRILKATPHTEQALIVNLGDWFHTDTPDNVTRRSGNRLDVDTRWQKVVRVGVSIMKYMIDQALRKHGSVRVVNEIGNHDDQSSYLLSLVLEAAYSQEPRVVVDTSPDSFHWCEFGTNLIGIHHGHKCKPQELYRVMAEHQREACGRCKYRYWYTGHVHNSRKMDIGGQVIESFRTLIPTDAWAHGEGYVSQRDICSIVLDKEYGECFRATVNVDAIRNS